MNTTPITVVGNLTDDPDLRFTPSGAACASFTVAVNRRRRDGDQWVDGEPSFHRVTVWRHLAEHCAESLKRGNRVLAAGVLEQRHWKDATSGEPRSAWQIGGTAVGAELRFATASITKAAQTARGEVAPDDPGATASRTRPPGWGVVQDAPAGDAEPPF